MIPQETIQEIIEKVDIVEWVEQYVPLKRSGSEWKGLCPFHTEKTPSFGVTPAKQSFYCFGCQEGGTVINFVMLYENLAFPDAVRRLAEKAGINIVEEEFDPRQAAKKKRRDEILRLQAAAAEFFHHLLLRDRGPDAGEARDYLKMRQLNIEIAREWKLGYAPKEQRQFFHWASQEKFTTEMLVEGGLAAWRDEANHRRGAYGRFRHRLMFPVMDQNGNVIAFSGRILSKDQKGGKYVNSPETPIFNKSRALFGFHKTRRPITKEGHAIICEGQIDLISAVDAGVENMVAPLGTALTEDHAKILRRQCEEATLCFDSDNAGIKAAGKAFRTLAPKGMLVRLALLPEGDDPDSFIRKNGLEAFQEVIRNAPEYFDFHIDRKGSRLSSGPLRDRLNFARDLAADIALVDNKMLQDSLINRIAAKLGVGEEEIRKQIAGAARVQGRTRKNQRIREIREQERSGAGGNAGAVRPVEITNRSIRLLCRLFLTDPAVKRQLGASPLPEYLSDVPESELLGMIWKGQYDPANPASVHAFIAVLPGPEQKAIEQIMKEVIPGASADWADHCLLNLERQGLQNRIAMIKARLGDESLPAEEVNRMTHELLGLQARRHEIASGNEANLG